MSHDSPDDKKLSKGEAQSEITDFYNIRRRERERKDGAHGGGGPAPAYATEREEDISDLHKRARLDMQQSRDPEAVAGGARLLTDKCVALEFIRRMEI